MRVAIGRDATVGLKLKVNTEYIHRTVAVDAIRRANVVRTYVSDVFGLHSGNAIPQNTFIQLSQLCC